MRGKDDEAREQYQEKIDTLSNLIPKSSREGIAHVARALGISSSAIHYRLNNPETIKQEHLLAADMLLFRLNHFAGVDTILADMRSSFDRAHRRMTGYSIDGRCTSLVATEPKAGRD